MFEKTLADLIRGLRTNKKNEQQFISQVLQEIKQELKSPEMPKKAIAIQKLNYLHMLGYDMSFAAFNMIEVISSQRFTHKRIGYLAASACFHEGTEVILLITNLLKKDMTSTNQFESGLALNCLSNICTPDLARDLASDVVSLLTSSKPYIKKKAILALYKIFLKFPDALRPAFARLREKLEDSDPAVVSAAVSVVTELATKYPKNYLSLAPTLFKILTESQNNLMSIKLVKLFGALAQVEPRIGKKLAQPLTNMINNSSSTSLVYECIQTCTLGLADNIPIMKLCLSKLRSFLEDPDQNLKYLALLAMNNIMKVHPKAVAEHKDLVAECLDDADQTIRLRALDLLEGLVTKKNLADVIRKLLDHVEKAEGSYKDSLVEKIISICSKQSYMFITDFEWYINVLIELSHVEGHKLGPLIASQLMDVSIRVQVVRPFAVKAMAALLMDTNIITENPSQAGNSEVIYSAAWVVGEFCSYLDDVPDVVRNMLDSRILSLPGHIQSVLMQSVLKIFASIAASSSPKAAAVNLLEPSAEAEAPSSSGDSETLNEIVEIMQQRLPTFAQSSHLEVQERACFILETLKLFNELQKIGAQVGASLASLFDEPLNPVAAKAQKKVPIPEGLDLDQWINQPEVEAEPEPDPNIWGGGLDYPSKYDDHDDEPATEHFPESRESAPKKSSRQDSMYILKGENKPNRSADVDVPPIVKLGKEFGPLKVSQGPKEALKRSGRPSKSAAPVTVLQDEMPEGASKSDEESSKAEEGGLGSINISAPLRDDEKLPTRAHRIVSAQPAQPAAQPQAKEPTKEHKHRKHGEGHKKHRSEKGEKGEKGEKKHRKRGEKSTKSSDKLIDLGFDPISSPQVADKQEERKKKRSSESKPKSGTSAPASAPSPAQLQASKYKTLLTDENLTVQYEFRVNPKEGKKVMVAFSFKNLSNVNISAVEFAIPGTLGTKVASSPKADWVLPVSGTTQHNIIFDCISFQQPQRLPGTLSYVCGDAPVKRDFNLVFPCSAFFLPVKADKEQFVSVLSGNSGTLFPATATVKPQKDFRSFCGALALLLHVELVFVETAASFYGRSIQSHHLCVYAKPLPDQSITVDIKCSDAGIASALAKEISAAF